MKTTLTFIAVMAVGMALTAPAKDPAASPKRAPNQAVTETLTQALAGPDGEYAALATYQAILKKFGDVQPYASIIDAEKRHIAALERQCAKYGVKIPENQWLGKIEAPATLPEAAAEGVRAEERNVALYDELLAKAKDYPDLIRVFGNLQFSSREHHLVAFKVAAEKGGKTDGFAGSGAGPGMRGGRGPGKGCCGGCGGCGLGPAWKNN